MSILFFSFFFYIYINSPSPSSPHVRSVYHIYINVVKYSFMFPHAFLQKIKNVHAFCQSQVHATSNPVLFSDCQPKSYPSRCYHNLTFLFFSFLFPYFFFFFFFFFYIITYLLMTIICATMIVVICLYHHHMPKSDMPIEVKFVSTNNIIMLNNISSGNKIKV
jgi:hypothetical protein